MIEEETYDNCERYYVTKPDYNHKLQEIIRQHLYHNPHKMLINGVDITFKSTNATLEKSGEPNIFFDLYIGKIGGKIHYAEIVATNDRLAHICGMKNIFKGYKRIADGKNNNKINGHLVHLIEPFSKECNKIDVRIISFNYNILSRGDQEAADKVYRNNDKNNNNNNNLKFIGIPIPEGALK